MEVFEPDFRAYVKAGYPQRKLTMTASRPCAAPSGGGFAMHSHLTRIRLAAVAALAIPALAGAASPGTPPAASASVVTAYVLNSGAVTPINTVTKTALKQISTKGGPSFLMAMTPNGKKVYVADYDGGPGVLPISTATNSPGKQILVARNPSALGVTPHSKTLYIVDQDSNNVDAISTATNQDVGGFETGETPVAIAIAPNAASGYVAN